METNIRNAVLSAIAKTTSFDDLGRVIVDTCAKEFDAEVCSIWRRYTDDRGLPRLRLLAASAKAPQTLAQEVTYLIHEGDATGEEADGVTGYVAQTGQEVHVSSFAQLKEQYGFCWRGWMDKTQWDGKPEENFHSLSAFPLLLGERLVGVFKLENKHNSPNGFPEADKHVFRELSPEIALVVHSYSLLESNEKKLIQVPARMVAELLGPFETKQLVSEIVKTAAESLHAEICSLWLVDPSGRRLHLADGYGFSTEARREQTYTLSSKDAPDDEIDGITAWVAVRKKPFWANSGEELRAHPSWKGKWDDQIWKQRNKEFRCLYAVPLIRGDTVIGVLKVENRIGETFFTDSDRVLCEIMASLIVLVLDLGQQVRATLIADLVHIIRSPIGQVPMNLSGLEQEIQKLLQADPAKLDRVKNYLNLIKRALLAVNVTSKTLVAFAQKADDLTTGHQVQSVLLTDLVVQRVSEIKPLLSDEITIVTDFDKNVRNATVDLDVTDTTRLQIAIDNIVHNAIKYSMPNGIVKVKLTRSDGDVILAIQDFGRGIPQDALPRIFEPGFTIRAPGHPQGTGMGLTTVKQILDRLGWKCEVSSEVSKGTTFRIMIPDRKDK